MLLSKRKFHLRLCPPSLHFLASEDPEGGKKQLCSSLGAAPLKHLCLMEPLPRDAPSALLLPHPCPVHILLPCADSSSCRRSHVTFTDPKEKEPKKQRNFLPKQAQLVATSPPNSHSTHVTVLHFYGLVKGTGQEVWKCMFRAEVTAAGRGPQQVILPKLLLRADKFIPETTRHNLLMWELQRLRDLLRLRR